jgi:hypothetical protein
MNIYDIILEWDYIILGLYSWYYNICSSAASFLDGPSRSFDGWDLPEAIPFSVPASNYLATPLRLTKTPTVGRPMLLGSQKCGSRVAFGRGFQRRFDLQMGDQVEIKWWLWDKNPVGVAQNSGRTMVGSRLRCSQKIGWINKNQKLGHTSFHFLGSFNRSTDLRPSQTSG